MGITVNYSLSVACCVLLILDSVMLSCSQKKVTSFRHGGHAQNTMDIEQIGDGSDSINGKANAGENEMARSVGDIYLTRSIKRLTLSQLVGFLKSTFKVESNVYAKLKVLRPDEGIFDSQVHEQVLNPAQFETWYSFVGAFTREIPVEAFEVEYSDDCLSGSQDKNDCSLGYAIGLGKAMYRTPLESDALSGFQNRIGSIQSSLPAEATLIELTRSIVEYMLMSPRFMFRILEDGEDDWHAMENILFATFGGDITSGDIRNARSFLNSDMTHEAFVDQIIADNRFTANLGNFVTQWYGADRYNLASDVTYQKFSREATQFVQDALASSDDWRSILKSDKGYYIPEIAEFTGLPATEDGSEGIVTLQSSRSLLDHAAFLAMSSNDSVSITKRGQLVSERLFCEPIPPPPKTVDADDTKVFSDSPCFSERMKAIGSDPSCKGCHLKMDPIGLGLYQYDNKGMIRELEDPSLPECSAQQVGAVYAFGGPEPEVVGEFSTTRKLSDLVRDNPKSHACMVQKLLSFISGKEKSQVDLKLVESVISDSKNTYSMQEIIKTNLSQLLEEVKPKEER